jgi:hypothetical protein
MTDPHVTYWVRHTRTSRPAATRELDSRVSGGVQVDLLWSEAKAARG